jgi:hypothetical protein
MTVQTTEPIEATLAEVCERLARIEDALRWLYHEQSRNAVKEFYTIAEFAAAVGRAEYTAREWARTARINAEKRYDGHGRSKSWVVSHAELVRFRREGLLPESFG